MASILWEDAFSSHGIPCAASVYRPSAPAAENVPVIVMAHGFGCVRTLRLPAYAERFAAAGYVVVAFDYRYFGDSAGWIPTSSLDTSPPPQEHLAMLEAQVAELQAKLDAAAREASADKERLEQLATTDTERDAAMQRMSEENRDLRAGERWPYLVTGAGILGIGLAVGLLLRGSTRRSSSRIRF